MIVILLPWQLVSLKEASTDFGMTFFCVSQDMFTDTLSSLWRLTPEFFFYMHKHFAYGPTGENTRRFLNFCDLLSLRTKYSPQNRRESIMQLLRVFYWDVYTVYVDDPRAGRLNYSRKEELAFRFLRLIIEEHAPNMELASYAAKLGVSAKYLTSLIRHMSGHSAREWIVYYTLLEIKSLLRESSLDLKTIAARANFPDQSSLARFFRRYTGHHAAAIPENHPFLIAAPRRTAYLRPGVCAPARACGGCSSQNRIVRGGIRRHGH